MNKANQEIDSYIVETVSIDALALSEVRLMQIDVEGHEVRVLECPLDTIHESRPIIIVKSKARHFKGGPRIVVKFLDNLCYS